VGFFSLARPKTAKSHTRSPDLCLVCPLPATSHDNSPHSIGSGKRNNMILSAETGWFSLPILMHSHKKRGSVSCHCVEGSGPQHTSEAYCTEIGAPCLKGAPIRQMSNRAPIPPRRSQVFRSNDTPVPSGLAFNPSGQSGHSPTLLPPNIGPLSTKSPPTHAVNAGTPLHPHPNGHHQHPQIPPPFVPSPQINESPPSPRSP